MRRSLLPANRSASCPARRGGATAPRPPKNLTLQEARYAHTVIQALRSTINSEEWQRRNGVSCIQQVWKLWTQQPPDAPRDQPLPLVDKISSAGAALASGREEIVSRESRSLPMLRPKLRKGAPNRSNIGGPSSFSSLRAASTAAAAAAAAKRAERQRSWSTSFKAPAPLPPPKLMDASALRAALALAFPGAPPLCDEEFELVYRSLDSTGRGCITLSTFSSVFAARRCDKAEDGARVASYVALPTWSDIVGGYIPREELADDVTYDGDLRGRRAADVGLQHGHGGPGALEDARGVAGGFGMGHETVVRDSLGWEMRTHGDLDANFVKWGEYRAQRVQARAEPRAAPKPQKPPAPPKQPPRRPPPLKPRCKLVDPRRRCAHVIEFALASQALIPCTRLLPCSRHMDPA